METIEVTRADGGIVTVTLNRPEKKNAINDVMWDELLATFREIAARATTGSWSSPAPAARSAPAPTSPAAGVDGGAQRRAPAGDDAPRR